MIIIIIIIMMMMMMMMMIIIIIIITTTIMRIRRRYTGGYVRRNSILRATSLPGRRFCTAVSETIIVARGSCLHFKILAPYAHIRVMFVTFKHSSCWPGRKRKLYSCPETVRVQNFTHMKLQRAIYNCTNSQLTHANTNDDNSGH
jgi:hypothetical protein